jgi:hypothetical protein
MNYNRRPNRPDGNVYREMRRRNMGRGFGGGGMPISPRVLLVATVVVVAVVAWIIWK